MKFKSLLNIFAEIKKIIDVNPVSTNIGVVTNEFAGEDYLIQIIKEFFENQSRTKVITIEGGDLNNPDSLYRLLATTIVEDFEDDISLDLINLSYTDLILSFLALLPKFNIENLIFIVSHFEQLSIDKQYTVLSQFRNVREKLKIQTNLTRCHFLVIGHFSYFEQAKICQHYGTSFTLDDIFYFSNSNRMEQDLILRDESIIKLNKQTLMDVVQDISGGSIGLLLLINNLNLPEDINELLVALCNDASIESKFSNAIKNLDSRTAKKIQDLAGRKPEIFKAGKDLENIYFSGVCDVKPFKDGYSVIVDSWLFEVQIKKIFQKNKKEHLIYQQLLPYQNSLNSLAYDIIMQIENYLRNTLISKLSSLNYHYHPLEILDCLGEVKSTTEGKLYTYYDWCKHKLYQHKNSYNVDLFESLSSQLDLTDLESIFLSEMVPTKYSEESFSQLLNVSITKEKLIQLFKRLKQIRNPIAHNQLINFSVLNELKSIQTVLLSKNN